MPRTRRLLSYPPDLAQTTGLHADRFRSFSVAGAGLLAMRGRRSRLAAATSGILLCAGAMCARWSVVKAGFASAADPKFVIGPQRRRIDMSSAPGQPENSPDCTPSPGVVK